MISFESDYMEGAHEAILQRLIETNLEVQSGYGFDDYTASAKEKIRKAADCPDAQIWFFMGGTQTNRIVIDSMLRPYEGVIAASTGHVSRHEAGAVESTGRKVLELPGVQGKLAAKDLRLYLNAFYADENHAHMVQPGMVYLSHPTELGTLYTKQELEELSAICGQYHIPLYLDGARLGYGLAAPGTDVSMEDIARCCSVFYIGGTKVGALCGEAVVFTRENMPEHFLTIAKRQGALPAKGRLLGLQFDVLFTDDLYTKISAHAIEMAMDLKEGLAARGYRFLTDSPTNQQFVIFPDSELEYLKTKAAFCFWETVDSDHTAVRLATSWATKKENIDTLFSLLDKIHQ